MDLKLIETGEGGDLVLMGNDLVITNGLHNMPYLGLFGGNPEQSTNGPKIPDEQAFDYWGNNLFYANEKVRQFNSSFERRCKEVSLTSYGRLQLENAIKSDLSFMSSFAIVSSDVTIVGSNRIRIDIKIEEPVNKQTTEFVYIWDGTKNELTSA